VAGEESGVSESVSAGIGESEGRVARICCGGCVSEFWQVRVRRSDWLNQAAPARTARFLRCGLGRETRGDQPLPSSSAPMTLPTKTTPVSDH